MAKVPSPFLTGATGKFAGAAFQQSPGNGTILREVVKPTNPSTEAQVEQRAKFKLMSQVATAFKSVIAMKREGNITPRNMFVKINSPLLDYDSESKMATIFLQNLQLTKSEQHVRMSDEGEKMLELDTTLPILYGAVFVRVRHDNNEKIAIMEIVTEESAEATDIIKHNFSNAQANDVIFAYGITQKTSGLKIKYGNYEYDNTEAQLTVLSSLAENSALTKTVSLKIR